MAKQKIKIINAESKNRFFYSNTAYIGLIQVKVLKGSACEYQLNGYRDKQNLKRVIKL